MLGIMRLAGSAVAQDSPADTASAPAAPMITVPAVGPGPIILPPEVTAVKDERFTGGHLVLLEGLFCYTRWEEKPDVYPMVVGYEPPAYQYTNRIIAAIASYNRIFSNGVSLGGSVGLLGAWTSRKLLSGQSYYSGDYQSSANLSLLGPRIGYYCTKVPGRVTPFVAAEYDLVSGSYNYSQSMLRVGGGVLIRVAPGAGISAGVDYVDISDQDKSMNVLGLVGMNFIFK